MEARRLGISEQDEIEFRARVHAEVMRDVREKIALRARRWKTLSGYYKERGDRELDRYYRIQSKAATKLLAQLPLE